MVAPAFGNQFGQRRLPLGESAKVAHAQFGKGRHALHQRPIGEPEVKVTGVEHGRGSEESCVTCLDREGEVRLRHHHAAVHLDSLTGQIASVLRSEEGRYASDFPRLGDAAQRAVPCAHGQPLF